MSYKLTITKTVPNPDYDEQAKAWNNRYDRYNNDYTNAPQPNYDQPSIYIELTDEEFKAIKKGVLEIV